AAGRSRGSLSRQHRSTSWYGGGAGGGLGAARGGGVENPARAGGPHRGRAGGPEGRGRGPARKRGAAGGGGRRRTAGGGGCGGADRPAGDGRGGVEHPRDAEVDHAGTVGPHQHVVRGEVRVEDISTVDRGQRRGGADHEAGQRPAGQRPLGLGELLERRPVDV